MSPDQIGNAIIGFLILGPFIIGMWVLLFVGLRNFVRRYW